MFCSLSQFVPKNLVSRGGFGRKFRVILLILHTSAEFGAYSRHSSRFPRRHPFTYTVNRHRISPQFIRSRACVPMAFTTPRYFLYHTYPLHTNSGCGERKAHINWFMVILEKAAPVTGTSEDCWLYAGRFSAANAIGTQLRGDPINSGLTQWRMAV